MLAQKLDRPQQQVVEIERGRFAKNRRCKLRVDLGGLLAHFVPRLVGVGAHLLRRDAVILGVADLRAQRARREIVGRQIELQQRTLDGRRLIVVIVNGEIARQSKMRRLAAEQPRAKRVERRDPHVGSRLPAGPRALR